MLHELKYDNCQHSKDPIISCALEGVVNILAGINDVCVLIHSPQGCSSTVANAFDHHEIDFSNRKVACSRLFEMDIIMGATEKLQELIRDADKAFNTKVMFIVGTCAADIIGENIEGICDEMQPQINARLIPIMAGGFRGNSYDGMALGLNSLFNFIQEPKPSISTKSVNIIAPQSSLNPTWFADLDWVKQMLTLMGIEVKTVFSHKTDLETIANASEASANILLSHDIGYKFAQKMEDKYGIPLILADMPLPIGCTNTARWLRALAQYFDVDNALVEDVIAKGEEHVVDILRRRGLMIIPRYKNCHVALSADSTFGIGMLRMLFEELEMIPDVLLLRSDNQQAKELLQNQLDEMGLSPQIAFGADGYVIKKALSESKVDAVLGSAWEHYIAEEAGIKISFDVLAPTNRDIYQDKTYFGYDGMLNILEIMGNDWEREFRSREIKWEQFQGN